jgi:hypothetical protein
MHYRYWRASALAGLLGLIMSFGMGVDLAAAHPGDEKQTDVEHAKEDLASTSIEKIEKETETNAAKIKKETGHTPGRRSDEQKVPNAKVSAAAAQDPAREAIGARYCRPASYRSSRQCSPTARY